MFFIDVGRVSICEFISKNAIAPYVNFWTILPLAFDELRSHPKRSAYLAITLVTFFGELSGIAKVG